MREITDDQLTHFKVKHDIEDGRMSYYFESIELIRTWHDEKGGMHVHIIGSQRQLLARLRDPERDKAHDMVLALALEIIKLKQRKWWHFGR